MSRVRIATSRAARRWRHASCAVAILLGGCGGSDPGRVIQAIESWSSALTLARTELEAHRVSARYAQQVLDRATEGRAEAARSLARASPDAQRRAKADEAMAGLDSEIATLSIALRRP